jgi:hypothetical protein
VGESVIQFLNLRRVLQLALFTLALATPLLAAQSGAPLPTLLDAGYHQMYDLQFDAAHKTFAEYQRAHPDDPMGPVSDAAAYLFAEFDRLHVLESELFVNDDKYENRAKLVPDANARRFFDAEINRAASLANAVLVKEPRNVNALFAKVLVAGLVGDYTALIEKKDLKALSIVKEGRTQAEDLLKIDPSCYDAYIAVGVENYLLSLKPAPVRWLLKMTGAQTDKQMGIEKLKLTAANGRYLKPYARMLLAVAALRDKDDVKARELLRDLSSQYPNNRLYAKELAKLNTTATPTKDYGTH